MTRKLFKEAKCYVMIYSEDRVFTMINTNICTDEKRRRLPCCGTPPPPADIEAYHGDGRSRTDYQAHSLSVPQYEIFVGKMFCI